MSNVLRHRMSSLEVTIFARQLSLMLEVGVPLADALSFLLPGQESEEAKAVVQSLLTGVEKGFSLSEGMARHPEALPPVLVSLVRIGEETGSLASSLGSAASWLEADRKVYKKLLAALTYPLLVAAAACILTLMLFTTVVPSLLDVLIDTGADIPVLTSVVMGVTRAANNPLCYLVVLGLFIQFGAIYKGVLARRPLMARFWNSCFRIPLLGKSLRSGALCRFCFACRSLLASGTHLTTSVKLGAEASGCALYQTDAARVVEAIKQGRQMSDALEEQPLWYDTRLVQFVRAGESTAKLEEMLESAEELLKVELDNTLERLSSVIEPVLLLSVGSGIGVILISVFLPLYASLQKL